MAENSTMAAKIGKRLVALCRDGKGLEAIDTLYDEKIVSIESSGTDEIPARTEGFEAVRGKSTWWVDNHVVHSMTTEGPYCGSRDDQFAVRFEVDVTFKPTAERTQMTEVGLYTVKKNKIVQEEFLVQVD